MADDARLPVEDRAKAVTAVGPGVVSASRLVRITRGRASAFSRTDDQEGRDCGIGLMTCVSSRERHHRPETSGAGRPERVRRGVNVGIFAVVCVFASTGMIDDGRQVIWAADSLDGFRSCRGWRGLWLDLRNDRRRFWLAGSKWGEEVPPPWAASRRDRMQ